MLQQLFPYKTNHSDSYSMEFGETVSEFDDHAPLLSGDFVK